MEKSSVEEIRARFDADVERFSNLQTGQSTTVDAPLAMDLVTSAAAKQRRQPKSILDIGCGAGNYTLALLLRLDAPPSKITLIDLSLPMLTRAVERIRDTGFEGEIVTIQQDVREVDLGIDQFDTVLASAVLHHLRTEEEWKNTFLNIYKSIKPGGGFWVFDLVSYEIPAVLDMMTQRYGDYLVGLKDEAYRDFVFAYVEHEDSQTPLTYQLDLLRQVGFAKTDVLHVNSCFAAFGGVKN